MCIRIRAFLLIILIFILFQPDISNGRETIRFKQGALKIDTSLYGGFLIDRDGFLWIGTIGLGVLRYDGFELKSFANSIQGSMISSIVEDRNGVIWISSFSKGITAYDKETGRFITYNHDPDNTNSLASNNISFSPQKLYVDKSNTLWVGTDDAGLCEYNRIKDTWTIHRNDPDNLNSLSDNAVSAITEGHDGALWVGTQNGGLNRYDRGTGAWTRYRHHRGDLNSLNDNWITSILEDQDGMLWVGTKKGGLNQLDRERNTFSHYTHDPNNPDSISSNDIWSLHEDHSGGIWVSHMVSSHSGLSLLDKKNTTFIRYRHEPDDPTSLSSNSVTRIYEDPRTKNLWVVNYTGHIDRQTKNTPHFRHWPGSPEIQNSLSDKTVLPIIEDKNNIVWAGTASGGLNRIDRETGKITHYLPDHNDPLSIPSMRITALFEDSEGILWIGFWDGILAGFNRETGRCMRIYEHNPDNPHSITKSERLKYILEDRDDPNILWLATIKGGLDKFDKRQESFTHFKFAPGNSNGLSHNSMPTLYDDGKGMLWIPTYGGGLDRFDKKTGLFKNYRHRNNKPTSIGSNTLYEVIETADGKLWIARKGGISQFDPESGIFKNYNKDDDGISYGPVCSLLQDGTGNLWLGTVGAGLVRFIPGTGATKRFTKEDGLQSNTFFWTSRLKTNSGEMWFGGSNGISSFHPSRIVKNQYVPPIMLTEFTQGGEIVNTGTSPERLNKAVLHWRSNYFEFKFAALSFTAPKMNRYAYMLEGWDEEWYYSGSNPFGRYSGLAGGQYKLRLKGSNNDGVWNNDGVSITVVVTPPFWETIWFKSTFAAVGLFFILGIVFYVRKMGAEIIGHKEAEKALQESREKYRRLTENAKDMIYRMSLPEGLYEYVSPASIDLFGYKPKEFYQSPLLIQSVIHPAWVDYFKEQWENLISGNMPSFYEYQIIHKSGEERWMHQRNVLIVNDFGHPKAIEGIVTDITQRKQAEEALRASEKDLKASQRFAHLGSWRLDLATNQVVWTEELYKMYGFDPALPPPSYTEHMKLFTPESWDRLSTSLARTNETGIPYELELETVKEDGSNGWMWVRGEAVKDSAGNTIGLWGAAQDITDRKKDEEQLKIELYLNKAIAEISNELLSEKYNVKNVSDVALHYSRKLTNSTHGFVSSIDKNTLENVGHTLTDMFSEQCTIKNQQITFPIDDDGKYGALWGHALNTKKAFFTNSPYNHEKFKGLPKGHIPLKNYMAVPVLMRNNLLGLIALSNSDREYNEQDILHIQRISEIFALALHRQAYEFKREELENSLRQLQKNEAIGALAGGIAHDFNNILFPIVGFAEMLEEDISENSPLRESVNEILIGAKRAKELVKQILTFSRQTEQELKPLKPQLVIKEAIKLIKATIPTTIEIKHNIDPECRTIMADPTQIHQIAMNLITNSYHAMLDSGGVLSITLKNIDLNDNVNHLRIAAGPHILLSIEDTGIGMNQNTVEKIFDPYFSTKPKDKGTGLGLSVVQGIVNNYGGDIEVESTLGQGSQFNIYLPAYVSEAVIEKKIETLSNQEGNERILLVDDESTILRVEQKMLERLGYEIEMTDSSEEALNKIISFPHKYDLIITDMTMPKMTGDVLAQEIKKINPALPIIICTGFSEKLTPKRASKMGINKILLKPIVKIELLKAIRKIFD